MTNSIIEFRIAAILFALFISLLINVRPLQAQGKLGRIRESVRQHDHHDEDQHRDHDDEDNDHSHRPRRRHRDHHRHFGCSLNFGVDDCPPVVEHVYIYEPAPVFVGPAPVVDASPRYSHDDAFIPSTEFASPFSRWNGRLTAFAGSDVDAITHGSLGLLVQSPGFLGLDIGINMFRETGASFRDHLWLGDVNLVYEAINFDDFRARIGAGINWLGDYEGGNAGANLTFGMDWQLNPRWVLTGEVDFGNLGDTNLFHSQLSIGRQFEHVEWSTGYNYYDIGGTPIGGIFTGLRIRF